MYITFVSTIYILLLRLKILQEYMYVH